MRWDKNKEQENKEKTKDFQAKMAQGYDFKKAYAARRGGEEITTMAQLEKAVAV